MNSFTKFGTSLSQLEELPKLLSKPLQKSTIKFITSHYLQQHPHLKRLQRAQAKLSPLKGGLYKQLAGRRFPERDYPRHVENHPASSEEDVIDTKLKDASASVQEQSGHFIPDVSLLESNKPLRELPNWRRKLPKSKEVSEPYLELDNESALEWGPTGWRRPTMRFPLADQIMRYNSDKKDHFKP